MITATQLSAAYSLDMLFGDPEWFPHPVRLFGYLTWTGESLLRPLTKGPRSEFVAGTALTSIVVSVAWLLGRPRNSAWRVMLAWNSLATRSLLNEAAAVIACLASGQAELARRRVSRIVGRDTAQLDEVEISRAVIETLAESACDGIVAPLFWLAIGGVPAAMTYKAVNTLDSMIGHRDPRYLYFGRLAARLDDAANYIPARLTAFGICLSAYLLGLDAKGARYIWLRDGDLHASPNAGQSEAAMAGALGVRLGGVNSYGGVPHLGPALNALAPAASVRAAKLAASVVALVSATAFGASLLVVVMRQRRR